MHRPLLLTMTATILWMTDPIPDLRAETAEDKAAVCAGCHGPRGHSAVPANPILAAQHEQYLGSALQAYISGERDYGIMKTMAERLGKEGIAELASYYAGQPPHNSGATARGDAGRGAGKIAVCVACHGGDGQGTSPLFPRLAGQHAAYLGKALRDYRSGARRNNLMVQQLTEQLSDQDIDDIAAYYAAQPAQR